MKIKTPEEILAEKGVAINIDGNEYLKYGVTLNKIKEAMKAYADQFELTDEEIKKLYPVISNQKVDGESWNNRYRQKCAKWYRDEQKRRRNET